MSAAELHAPARAGSVLWHYLRLFGRHQTVVPMVVTFFVGMLAEMNSEGFEGFAASVPLMALLPLVQWGASTRRGELDAAMPLGRARHDLLWVAAGAVWAVAAMVPPLAVVTALWTVGPHARPLAAVAWYPPVILGAGLACYLVGVAVWLRGHSRPGPMLCVFFVLAIMPEVLLGSRWPRLERLLALRDAPAPGEGVALLLAAWLAAAAAAALACLVVVGTHRWGPRFRAGRAARPRRRLVREPVAAGVPRRPTRLHSVIRGELRLLRGPTLAAAAIVVVATLWMVPALSSVSSPDVPAMWAFPVIFTAVAWPMVVWLRGRGPWHRGLDPVPVSALAMRLARVAAGAVCLELVLLAAVAAHVAGAGGGLRPAGQYAGVGCVMLLLYLAASFPQVLARDHLLGWSMGWMGTLQMFVIPMMRAAPEGMLSPSTALSAILPQPGPWVAPALLWLAVLSALLAWTAWIGVIRDRRDPIEGFQVAGYLAAVARAG